MSMNFEIELSNNPSHSLLSHQKKIDNQQISNTNPIQKSENKNNILNLFFVSIIFMILFSAYNTAQNMISQIYTQSLQMPTLGKLTLFFVYFSYCISNFFASYFVEKLGYKVSMIFSSLAYVIFLSAGIIACTCERNEIETNDSRFYCSEFFITFINVLFGIICGSAAGIIWVAQSGYTSSLCDENNKGKFFGIFSALHLSSQIWGNLFSSIVLKLWSHLTYFIILFFIALFSCSMFLFLPNVEMVKNEEEIGMLNKLNVFIKTLKLKKIQIFFILCLFSGFIPGFYAGFFYQIIQDSILSNDIGEINQKTANIFLCIGLFEIIGGLSISKLGDKLDKYFLAIFAVLIIELALLLSLFAHYESNYFVCFLASSAWGIGESMTLSLISSIISIDFENSLEAFAVSKLGQAGGVLISLFLLIILDGYNKSIFIFIVILIQIITTLSIFELQKLSKSRKNII